MIQQTTRVALYSGFTVSLDDFKALVKAVWHAGENSPDALDTYTTAYDQWRRRIPISDRHRVPRPRVLFKSGCSNGSESGKTVDRLFFPIRWVAYEDDSQLERTAENRELWTPNDTDKARLTQFGKFVASQPGCQGFELPDPAHFGFGCIKDIHPAFEWKD